MKRALFLILLISPYGISRAEPTASVSPSPSTKLLHAFLAKNKEGDPTASFLSDASKLYAFWQGDALKAGDKVRAIWVAEGLGRGLRDTKIAQASTTAYKPDDDGAFALARPPGGWPVGKYRVEVYVGDKLVENLKFKIEPGVVVEVR